MLPVRYRPGQRYPLIVVQYVTRGFLRGGTGDEYPIQVFANNGFAVLSIERPRSPAIAPNARSYTDLDKADLAGFLDKRNVLSAIERGVRNLVDAGIVDERRVGITGLSDGASTVQYAGVHSKMFAAAVMSNCCAEPTQLALLGPAAAKLFREVGWPDLTSEAPSFWSNISWVVNARRIPFPVLLQMADSEYRSGLAAFTALREADVAIEMRVFPNETHFKWQPIHRLSIYTRNLNWFSFWHPSISSNRTRRCAGLQIMVNPGMVVMSKSVYRYLQFINQQESQEQMQVLFEVQKTGLRETCFASEACGPSSDGKFGCYSPLGRSLVCRSAPFLYSLKR